MHEVFFPHPSKVGFFICVNLNKCQKFLYICIEDYQNNVGLRYEVYNCHIKFDFGVGIDNTRIYQIRIKKKLIDKYQPLNRIAKIKTLYESD